jgi:hypothetical protein
VKFVRFSVRETVEDGQSFQLGGLSQDQDSHELSMRSEACMQDQRFMPHRPKLQTRAQAPGAATPTYTVLCLSGVFLALLAMSPPRYAAQDHGLLFQNRGSYKEGIVTSPSNAPLLELIAVLADSPEAGRRLPQLLHAAFYLPTSDRVYLTIQELDPLYNYMVTTEANRDGKRGRADEFPWPTATVISKLTWRGPLLLENLGAVARLRTWTPETAEEVVVPVALYHTNPPRTPKAYSFVFFPNQKMSLKMQVFTDKGASALASQNFPSLPAKRSHTVTWEAGAWIEGWYRLVVSGYSLQDNTEVNSTVRFYHSRRLVN